MDKMFPLEQSLPWTFTDEPVTAWGGLRLIQEMLTPQRRAWFEGLFDQFRHFRREHTESPLQAPDYQPAADDHGRSKCRPAPAG